MSKRKRKNITKMQKSIKTIIEIILEQIYNDCFESPNETIVGNVEITVGETVYGYVDYKVSKNVLYAGSYGTNDTPPEAEEAEFYLDEATVTNCVNENCIERTNIIAAVNAGLVAKRGELIF